MTGNILGRQRWRRGAALSVAAVALTALLAALAPSVASGQADRARDWTQIGADLNGEAVGDQSGWSVAMSADGTRVVIGAIGNDAASPESGQVRVFDFDGTTWNQTGTDINGTAAYDRSGSAVAISADGNRIAIGAPKNDDNGFASGHVRVFDFDGADWKQTGTTINGKAANHESGSALALSADGNRIAIGAVFANGNGFASGHVRVFDFDGAGWEQTGTTINGEAARDRSASSMALSADGNRIAIGAIFNDDNGSNSGHVRVYDFDGADWNQTGDDIDGEAAGDHSGGAVALSAGGNRIAIGATGNDDNGADSGHVRVFDFDGADWNQTGDDIDGEAAGDWSGWSLAMASDGNRIAIGAERNDENGPRSGHLRTYDFNGSAWNQTGTDVSGKAAGDSSGWSVAMSNDGDRVAIAAVGNDDNARGSGQVRVYQFAPTGFSIADGDVVVLRNGGTGRFLDGDGSHRAWNVDTSPEAKWDAGWRLSDNGDGSWSLLNRRRTRYLDGDGSGQAWNVGQSVQLSADDRWQILDNGDGTYALRNANFDRYLAQASLDNKNVITTDDPGNDLARWEITVAG